MILIASAVPKVFAVFIANAVEPVLWSTLMALPLATAAVFTCKPELLASFLLITIPLPVVVVTSIPVPAVPSTSIPLVVLLVLVVLLTCKPIELEGLAPVILISKPLVLIPVELLLISKPSVLAPLPLRFNSKPVLFKPVPVLLISKPSTSLPLPEFVILKPLALAPLPLTDTV